MGLGIRRRINVLTSTFVFAAHRARRRLSAQQCPACGANQWKEVYNSKPNWIEMCTCCGLGVTYPRLASGNQEQLHVDVYSEPAYVQTYLAHYAPYLNHSFRRGLERLQRHALSHSALLDIGCGFGFFLQIARDEGFAVEGIEVACALAQAGQARYGIKIQCGSVDSVSFTKHTWDIATAWDMLEHCAHPVETLTRIKDLLKPGGLVLLRVPNFSFIDTSLPETFRRDYIERVYPLDPGQHAFHFSRKSLGLILARLSFQVVEEWLSVDDEYTPRDFPEYPVLLQQMREYGIACEMNVLCRLESEK